jgi:hypothetical protein
MMESEQFKTPHETSSAGSQSSERCPPQIAAQRAALLFGCYRRGDANDPDTYCTAVAAVLASFPQHVVEYVTDPRTGIPGIEQWLPSVAEVKQACIKRQAYLDRLEDFDRRFGNRPPVTTLLTFDKRRPGRRANVFVPADAPQYPRWREASKTADPADWKLDERGRPGIWIGLGLLYDSTRHHGSTSTMTDRPRTQSERKQKEQEIANEASALPDLQANGGEDCKGWDSVGRLVDSRAYRGSAQPPTSNGSAQPPTPDVLRNEPTSTGI